MAILKLKPEYLKKDGKKEFVILAYKDFLKIEETLQDYSDLIALRKAKKSEKNKKKISLSDAKKLLGVQ